MLDVVLFPLLCSFGIAPVTLPCDAALVGNNIYAWVLGRAYATKPRIALGPTCDIHSFAEGTFSPLVLQLI